MLESSTPLTLLDGVRRREQDAWNRLVFLFSPLVAYWIKKWGITGADADDIRQEVFHAVATAIDSFRRDRPGDTFRGWLQVIARRKFLDHCRQKDRQPQAEGGSQAHRQMLELADGEPLPNDESNEVSDLHHRALELLRSQFEEHTWKAFWRCAVDGQLPVDVGQEMGMTPAAVRKAKSRVLRRLKEDLGDVLG